MIRLVGEDTFPLLLKYCENSPIGLGICGTAKSYGLAVPFAEYWLQWDNEESITGAAARLDSSLHVLMGEKSCKEEMYSFLSMLPGIKRMISPPMEGVEAYGWKMSSQGRLYLLRIPPSKALELEREKKIFPVETAAELFPLLTMGGQGLDSHKPDDQAFYTDLSHRLRHGQLYACGIRQGERLICAGMLMAQAGSLSLIGGLVTVEAFRRQGLAGSVVRHLCKQAVENGRLPCLLARPEVFHFYEGLGFTQAGQWMEYQRTETG